MDGLAPLDAWAIMAIAAKAAGYAAALLAMGGPLFLVAFPQADTEVRELARNIAIAAALVGLFVLALRFGIRAARLSGMGWPGAGDPTMLGVVWTSPLGSAAIWRGTGEFLVLALLVGGVLGLGAGLIGTLLVPFSYTFVGHSLGDPRGLLAILLSLHLMTAAFWVAALAPLRRAIDRPGGASLMHLFGNVAGVTVALLVVTGVAFAWFVTGSFESLFSTAYGWALIAKLGVVAGLLTLAALDKWRFVPALASRDAAAPIRLRRSIQSVCVARSIWKPWPCCLASSPLRRSPPLQSHQQTCEQEP